MLIFLDRKVQNLKMINVLLWENVIWNRIVHTVEIVDM